MTDLQEIIEQCLKDITLFCKYTSTITLRAYQVDVAEAIVASVIGKKGLSFVVMFPRQSGKNELQAQIEAYLLTLLQNIQAELVKISPTWKPQSLNAMHRLQRVLERNALVREAWSKSSGYIYQIGQARMTFLSGEPTAHIVGATASTLLEVDEAQDVQTAKYDKDIAPMAASTNATRVFWGTAWTKSTLLARELRSARAAQQADDIRRVFVLDADQVTAEVPAYGAFVAAQVASMGRNHPMIRTQFYSEEIDAEGLLFNAARIALMHGKHPPQSAPAKDHVYAFLLDVAGESDLAVMDTHDATSLTIVDIDLFGLVEDLIAAPVYRVVCRQEWQGVGHTTIYRQIKTLSDHWDPRYIVIDATGIGAGLASFLEASLPHKVIPFIFTQASKSKLGWDFLSAIETGRFKDHAVNPDRPDPLQARFYNQLEFIEQSVSDGPGRLLSWGVPNGARDPQNGEPVHDDLVISAALCTVLDDRSWGRALSEVIPPLDPLGGWVW